MQKHIQLISQSKPEQPGYLDAVTVLNGSTPSHWDDGISCCPNPSRPWPLTMIKWKSFCAMVAPQAGLWKCIQHEKYRKCIRLNNADRVATLNPNPSHAGAYYAVGVLIHKGFNKTWRGSIACITVCPDLYAAWIAQFQIGESGTFQIC